MSVLAEIAAAGAEADVVAWWTDPMWVALAAIGLGGSAVFSGLEIGLYTLNRVKLAVAAERGDRRAARLQQELAQPERLLAALLIGNNMVNYLGTVAIAALLNRMGLGPVESVVVNTAVVVPLLLVFGEILPKDLFRTFTDRWTYGFSGFLAGLRVTLTAIGLIPIARGVGLAAARLIGGRPSGGPSAAQRISHLFREGARAGVLSGEQISMVDRAFEMRRRTVSSEMTTWPRVSHLRLDATPGERTRIIRSRPFSRFPVVDPTGRVRGLVHALDAILDRERPTADLIGPVETVGPRTPVLEAIRRMRRSRVRLAVVVGPNQRPLGVVGLKDLVEPLTGDLRAW